MTSRKTRGGQKKHWAEKARVWAWYGDIKRRSGLTDYQLDVEFAWRNRPQNVPTSDERPRAFEWIRKSARAPRGLDPRWRSMGELVDALDSDPRLNGTKRLYEAEIWDLFQEERPTPSRVQERIEKILRANDLIRMPAGKIKGRSSDNTELTPPSLFDRCLRLSLRSLDRLTALSLLWNLYLHTEPAHNAQFRAVVEIIIDNHLDHFFADYCADQHFDFYDDAIGCLLKTRLDLTTQDINGYGYLEVTSTWPILPKYFVGSISG